MPRHWGKWGPSRPYPEIDIEIPTSSEFSVADLEGYRHLIVFVELFVEAFSRMRSHLDVVGKSGSEEDGQHDTCCEGWNVHIEPGGEQW